MQVELSYAAAAVGEHFANVPHYVWENAENEITPETTKNYLQ